MIQLNSLQYSVLKNPSISDAYSLSALRANDAFETICSEYNERFAYKKIKTFALSKEGFLGLFLELKSSTIAISKGECEALIDAAKMYEALGFSLLWLELRRDGSVNTEALKTQEIEYVFLSSYVMDTFVTTDLYSIKNLTKAKIISNATAHRDQNSDIIYFDNYKLLGFNTSAVLLFNDESFALLPIGTIDTIAVKLALDALKIQYFNKQLKQSFLEKLKSKLQDDIYFFVDPSLTLEYSLHFALKGIKARELIRTLALSEIFISNGEGCSLGLSRPSRIIQEMGYTQDTSREALSLSFCCDLSVQQIEETVEILARKYKQLKLLND